MMTLHEVLERAAELSPVSRWQLFCDVCQQRHDLSSLPHTTTGGLPRSPRYCPVCFTAFSPVSWRMWNPPFEPYPSQPSSPTATV
jgi:hypothetical protein